jgi:preprotein translocase subunit SecD
MGVDSNVLIFERISEEIRHARRSGGGRGRFRPRVPDDSRHPRGLADFGGVPVPVRHRPDSRFATTLTIGLLSNVFTAVFVSRTAFELLCRAEDPTTLSI